MGNRDKFDESHCTVSSWVGKIAKNVVLDAVRIEKRRRSSFSSAPLVERVDEDGNAVGFVQVAGDETEALAIAHDTERVLRESVSAGRDTRLLNGLLNDLTRLLQPRREVGTPTVRRPSAACASVYARKSDSQGGLSGPLLRIPGSRDGSVHLDIEVQSEAV